MTTSKSDLEAKEGQVPNESNFLEFVSLLGSLSGRAGASGARDHQGSECKEETGAAEEDGPPHTGWSPPEPQLHACHLPLRICRQNP